MNNAIFDLVLEERARQERLHGEYNNAIPLFDFEWIGITLEELGEASEALQYIKNQGEVTPDLIEHYEHELVQVIASAWQILERLGKEFGLYGQQ